MNGIPRIPYAEIVYEPSPVYRMRYEAENRSTHLVAENYVPDRENASSGKNRKKQQTSEGQYPRVKIVDGEGPATLMISCVNKTEPYHVHPHKLVGLNCKHGVAVFNIDKKKNIFDLTGVSIQFTKKSDIEKRIQELKEKNVDPFNVGFDFDRQSIDLSSVRLCFQIYLRDSFDTTEIIRDKYHILKPVVSQVISNSSRKITLSIISAFNLSSSCNGGSDVIIFIKKLEKDQKPLKAKFYDSSGWTSIVDIEDSKIHYQCAISFKAPQYPKRIDKEETVFVKLFIPAKTDEEKDNEEEDSFDLNNQASPSSHSSSFESKQLGQYESREIEFVYIPSKSATMPLNNGDFLNDSQTRSQIPSQDESLPTVASKRIFTDYSCPEKEYKKTKYNNSTNEREIMKCFTNDSEPGNNYGVSQVNSEIDQPDFDQEFFNLLQNPINDSEPGNNYGISQANSEIDQPDFDQEFFNILQNLPIFTSNL